MPIRNCLQVRERGRSQVELPATGHWTRGHNPVASCWMDEDNIKRTMRIGGPSTDGRAQDRACRGQCGWSQRKMPAKHQLLSLAER